MIRTNNWQPETLEELHKTLFKNEHVLAFAHFGSTVSSRKVDMASDLDVLVVVSEENFSQFLSSIDWLKPFGELYAVQRFENESHGTIRVCLFDFRRFDILVTTPPRLDQIDVWQRNPFWLGIRVLFSRSSDIANSITKTWQPPTPTFPSQVEFDEMVNNFWFKAMLSGYKVLRNDRLMAAHLALDLVRDCCVLGMILRDRATGTNIHHEGGEGNCLVDEWNTPFLSFSGINLLDSIERSSVLFDQLASQWSETYHEKRYPLLEWLELIKSKIGANSDLSVNFFS